MMEDIRKLFQEQTKDCPDAYNITSKLNWYRYSRQVRNLAKIIPQNSIICDIGCGWGLTSVMLSFLRKDLEIYAIDINPHPYGINCWKKMKKYNIKFLVKNAEHTKFKNNTFDVAISFGLMEHVRNKPKFLKEVHRILKNNGLFFIFNLPNRHSINEFMAKKLGIWHHECKFSLREVNNMLSTYGFKVMNSKIEFLIPAQVNRISNILNNAFNSNYLFLQKIDDTLTKTPLNLFAEAISVNCKAIK